MDLTTGLRDRGCILGLLVALSLSMAACSSNARSTSSPSAAAPNRGEIEYRLRQAADEWAGTPHRIGGLDHNGIDCSGLAVRIFDDLFGYHLPRTTGAQARTGRPTSRQGLAPGDLVLFRIQGNKQHVGIYLGHGEFIHASTTGGVLISSLDDRYWRRQFWTARRILD